MKNRFLDMKMGSRTRPDYPRPRKTWKTDRKPRKTRKFENLGSADGAKPLVFDGFRGISTGRPTDRPTDQRVFHFSPGKNPEPDSNATMGLSLIHI